MNDVVSDIKSRLDIVDVVSQYVQLKKAGHNYKGLCPFHSEKTPSFVVSTEKQIAHCFGCNKGGDIFSFVQEVEGVSFFEALEILAERAGVKIEKIKKSMSKEKKGEKEEFFKAHDLACLFFEEKLYKTNDGKKVLKYLHKRGVKDETIKEFRIGFSPDDYNELYTYLLKKGVSKKVLIKSGFVTAKNLADDRIYDKYRARLMFPIFDYFGRICGFGGRALKKDQMPKYLNSPENIIYSKSKVLYGLSHAKKAIKENEKVILVEGYFDVILPYQEGVENVVATSGTALTKEQVRMLKRLTINVVTCFDADKAGFEATKRAYELLLPENMGMKTVTLDEKDPADVVVDQGGDVLKKAFSDANDFMTFYIGKLVETNEIGTVEGRRKILSQILPLYKMIAPSSRDIYVRDLAGRLNLPERFLYEEIELFKLPYSHPAKKVVESTEKFRINTAEMIISFILEYPGYFEKVVKYLNEKYFEGDVKAIYKELYGQYNSSRVARTEWVFDKAFSAELRGKVDVLKLYAEERYGNFSDEVLENELDKLIDKVVKDCKKSRLSEIQTKIFEAEKEGNKELMMELLKEHQKLLS